MNKIRGVNQIVGHTTGSLKITGKLPKAPENY